MWSLRCGLEAPLMTSWTDSNPDRLFLGVGCIRYKVIKGVAILFGMMMKCLQELKRLSLHYKKKLDQERAKMDEANIKVAKVKTKLNSMNLMMKFFVSINICFGNRISVIKYNEVVFSIGVNLGLSGCCQLRISVDNCWIVVIK
ncbi:unnamed protein product [Vicia faba]|uniref:Uncharacterized protein n=1 Tax=Vicia faba TaxID=3906 RepID=A0AAV1ASL7_VICFA|nr:unnamed protein product [Vicia faba]